MIGAFGGATVGARMRPGVNVAASAASGLLLDIRWDTATGSTETALRDGTIASPITGGNRNCGATFADVLAVVAGNTVGWTLLKTERVLVVAGGA